MLLVYAYDPRDRAKQQRALDVLKRLVQAERAALSAPCLSVTEDAEHERYLEGVRYLNPFSAAFDISILDG